VALAACTGSSAAATSPRTPTAAKRADARPGDLYSFATLDPLVRHDGPDAATRRPPVGHR